MVTTRRRSGLPRSIQIELLKYFCAGATARSAAELTGVNRNTAILFFHKLREVIFAELAASEPGLMGGEVEVDESYLGGSRKGKRGRGAAGKVPVFGLLKRGGKVHVVVIPNACTDTLFPIIGDKVRPDSIVYTDSFGAYDILDVSEFHHVRINHSELFAEDTNHINGIETSGTRQSGMGRPLGLLRGAFATVANGVARASRNEMQIDAAQFLRLHPLAFILSMIEKIPAGGFGLFQLN